MKYENHPYNSGRAARPGDHQTLLDVTVDFKLVLIIIFTFTPLSIVCSPPLSYLI